MSSSTELLDRYYFAELYNEPVYHGRSVTHIWLEILENLVPQNISDKAHILDLCCGRGKLVQELIKKGYRATGMDLSEKMLHYARENAPDAEFILEDARFFKLPPTFHVVVSPGGSLEEIASLEKLTNTFHNVWAALLENGYFAFSLSKEEGLARDEIESGFTDDYAWIVSESYDPEEKIRQTKGVVFQLINENWQRFEGTFLDRAYSPTEIKSALEKAGFKEVEIYHPGSDPTFFEMDEKIVYVARKLLS